jgi:hypothetical protein
MSHRTIEKARSFHLCNVAFPMVQAGDFSYPQDETAAAEWLRGHGYTPVRFSGDRWELSCGITVSRHGVVIRPKASAL